MKASVTALMLICLLVMTFSGCDNSMDDPDLPDNPVERAAILGLYNSYKESTMWEVREPATIRVQPIVPTKAFVQQHDPQELYCVCVEYEARYRVPWTTKDKSPWERTVRNILVIKTKAGFFMAMRPSTICPPLCE